jgi:hypothetical protein
MDFLEFTFDLWSGGIFIIFLLLPNIYFFNSRFKERTVYPTLELTRNERFIETTEGILRIPTFVYPFFLSLKFELDIFLLGLSITLLGMILYYFMWISIFTTPLDQPVTTGLFKFSRHPGHLIPFIIFVGLSICTFSLLYFFVSTVFVIFHCLNSLNEEKRELLKYGESYQNYVEKTPRWLGIPKNQI